MTLDIRKVRDDFPILKTSVHGKPLVYLDNAATTQKPRAVIDAVRRYYEAGNANIHRGLHALSELATKNYEDTRARVQRFLNAAEPREIIFVRGATEAINLVAQTFGRAKVGPGDEILITTMEHHSNIVPWQILRDEKRAVLRVAPIDDRGEVLLEEFERLLGPRTKIAAVTHVSNVLGTVNPVRRMIAMAHAKGIPVLVDGAQAVPHLAVDVRDLDADFYVFSGHKVYGPTGIGALYGKAAILEAMPPWQGGGDMIRSVTFEKTLYAGLPHKFEAGTPDIGGVAGLVAAIGYLEGLDRAAVAEHEADLLAYAHKVLSAVSGLAIVGTAREKAGAVSFTLAGVHPHDIGTILDREGIAIRAGHHCAQPVMERFGLPATGRASFAVYNTREEIDALAAALRRVSEVFHS